MKPKDGAKIIILSQDKILLFHRDNIPTIDSPDCWCFVGGGIEKDETPEQGLVREVREETGYELKKYSLVGKGKGSMGENVWMYVSFVEKEEESKFVIGPDEGQELGWFSIDEALALNLTSGSRSKILKYRHLIEEMMRTKTVPSITMGILE